MRKTSLPHRSSLREKLALPAIFLVVLGCVILLGILPTTREIGETQTGIGKLEADLKRQQTLLPVHHALQQRMAEALPDGISVNAIEPLKIEDLEELPDVFEDLARDSKVELVSVTPQARSLQGGREVVRVDTRLRGDFLTFNSLLNQLNEMTFVETIESLAIDVTELGQEMTLSVWLARQ